MNILETQLLKVGDRLIHSNTGCEATILAIDSDGVTVQRDKYVKKTKTTKNSWKILAKGATVKPLSDRNEILALMRFGWELGETRHHASKHAQHAWLQKTGLCKGGETRKVHRNTLKALLSHRLIRPIPRRAGDPYWLVRYEVSKPSHD